MHEAAFSNPLSPPKFEQGLKQRLEELMPVQQAALKTMKKEHGAKIVDKVTIDQLIGGARSIKCMLWETSLLDPLEVRVHRRDAGIAV